MAKRTLEELLGSVRVVLGDNDSDEAISLIEDITDSFTPDTENWKQRYEENDAQWRARYRERFYEGTPQPQNDFVEDEPKPKMTRFDDLFTEV